MTPTPRKSVLLALLLVQTETGSQITEASRINFVSFLFVNLITYQDFFLLKERTRVNVEDPVGSLEAL